MSYWKAKTEVAGEQVKHLVEPLISFIRHPFGPTDPADDPDYLDLRDRVLRNHGVWAPPAGRATRLATSPSSSGPSNPPGRGGNLERAIRSGGSRWW
jgi:hypothetical protein